MPGATALAQARAAGTFTPAHDAFWALARKSAGDGGGTRLLVEALLLHRHLAHADVGVGLAAAVSVGSASPDVVAVEARKAGAPAPPFLQRCRLQIRRPRASPPPATTW